MEWKKTLIGIVTVVVLVLIGLGIYLAVDYRRIAKKAECTRKGNCPPSNKALAEKKIEEEKAQSIESAATATIQSALSTPTVQISTVTSTSITGVHKDKLSSDGDKIAQKDAKSKIEKETKKRTRYHWAMPDDSQVYSTQWQQKKATEEGACCGSKRETAIDDKEEMKVKTRQHTDCHKAPTAAVFSDSPLVTP